MEIRSLKFFMVVAEEQNIGRASLRLHLSQPALTRQMQSLEEELDVQLFTRCVSGVRLTTAGMTLLEHARNICSEFELTRRDVQRAVRELVGKVDIGVNGSAIFNIIPQLLQQFSLANPGIRYVLRQAPKRFQIEALRQGSVLIAFDRYFPEDPAIATELVHQERMLVALHHQNPLASKDALQFSDLADEPYVESHSDSDSFNPMQKIFQHHAFAPNCIQRTSDVLSAVALVGCGYGITVVPASLRTLQIPHVTYRPLLSDIESCWELCCAYRKGEKSELLLAILKTVREFRAAQACVV